MFDLICDVISCCVSCDKGKINVYDKIVTEKPEKRKRRKSKNFYINLDLKDGLKWNSQLAKDS